MDSIPVSSIASQATPMACVIPFQTRHAVAVENLATEQMTQAPPRAKRQPKPNVKPKPKPAPEILKRSVHGATVVYAVSSVSDPLYTVHPVTIDPETLTVEHCGQCEGWTYTHPHHCSHGDLALEAEVRYQEERRQEARRTARQATVELCARCDRPASPRYADAGLCTLHGYRDERVSS